MGDVFIGSHLNPFRVDEDKLAFRGGHVIQDREDDAIQANALTRTGLPSDEQVGHFGQVDDLGDTNGVYTYAYGYPITLCRSQNRFQADGRQLIIGHFDTYQARARDRGQDTDTAGHQGNSQVRRRSIGHWRAWCR